MHTHSSMAPRQLVMGPGWLGLMFALAAALPDCVEGDVPATEVPAPAPCPADESTVAPEGEHRLVPRFSVCMLRCASQAMLEMAAAKSSVSLKLNEGREGEEHEFCWTLRLRCQKGERLTKAFVLLNLERPPDGGPPPPYRLLLTTPPSLRQYLQARQGYRGPRLLSGEVCGTRFDVTEPFRRAEWGRDAEMCVKAVCPEEDVCRALRLGLHCPPFLATLWRSVPRPDG